MKWIARLLCLAWLAMGSLASAQDPLPSWMAGDAKQAVMDFVARVTDEDSPQFVPAAERIAVFDNDGTLWSECPVPNQLAFAIDEIKSGLAEHPEWQQEPAVVALQTGDFQALLDNHHQGLLKIIALTHAGMTVDEFNQSVAAWLAQARHPRFEVPYTQTTYQPMLELLTYLRNHGFETWIVSGGGKEFMRVFSEQTYGIPPQQIIGSYGQLKYELKDGKPTLTKTLDTLFVDDKEGKPVGIQQFIGRRPIACFGNSDGDQAMLEYTTIDNPRPSFGMIIHHTDADREYAYDANPTSSGKLTTALADAPQRGWVVVDMQRDWKRVFAETPVAEKMELVGNTWLVEEIGGQAVVEGSRASITFADDGAASGSTSVNRFSGKVTLDGNALSFGPLATTRRAGPPALMDQEQKFIAALAACASYRSSAPDKVELLNADGQTVVKLSKP